jgi:hypothetical protein
MRRVSSLAWNSPDTPARRLSSISPPDKHLA